MLRKDLAEIDPINTERREKVKEAMLHAWNSYVKYAWGMDELQVCFSNSVLSFFSFSNLSRQTLRCFSFFTFTAAIKEWC
jgi:hypothetical protein